MMKANQLQISSPDKTVTFTYPHPPDTLCECGNFRVLPKVYSKHRQPPKSKRSQSTSKIDFAIFIPKITKATSYDSGGGDGL